VRKYRRRRLGKNCARDITFHFARERFLLCKLVNILTSVVVFQRFNGRAVPFFLRKCLVSQTCKCTRASLDGDGSGSKDQM
jgi:hypothetical protein